VHILGVLKYHQGILSLQWGKQEVHSFQRCDFLESTKNEKIIERQLDHLDQFTHVKTYCEFDDEIPHLEGGVPILDQSLESPFEVRSSPHEEDPTTSLEEEVQLQYT